MFPETTAALRRLARAIAGLFKSREQLYAEMMQREEEAAWQEALQAHWYKLEEEQFLYRHGLMGADELEGGIDRTSSPWWRVKDYEEAETGEK